MSSSLSNSNMVSLGEVHSDMFPRLSGRSIPGRVWKGIIAVLALEEFFLLVGGENNAGDGQGVMCHPFPAAEEAEARIPAVRRAPREATRQEIDEHNIIHLSSCALSAHPVLLSRRSFRPTKELEVKTVRKKGMSSTPYRLLVHEGRRSR